MKPTYYIIAFLILSKNLVAQTVITNRYFPEKGDVLARAIASDATTSRLTITPSDENQLWDYSFLDSAGLVVERYEAASDAIKQEFPQADLVTTIDGQQVIFNKTDSRFEILGLKNIRYQNQIFNISLIPDNPVLERRADLTYITVHNNLSTATTIVSPNQLPDSLINRLPVRPNAVRITLTNSRQDYVDAWGTLKIPKGSFNVLRVRTIEIIEKKVEININGNWLDVTPQYFGGNPAPQDTIIRYDFWSEGVKTPILKLTVDANSTVTRAEYRVEAPKTVAVSGVVRFWTGQPLPNVTIKIGTDSMKTNTSGQFNFPNIEVGKTLPVSVSKTDTYENGVDGLDLLLIRRHILGLAEFDSPFKFFSGDIDDNQDIDGIDLLYMRRLIVSIYTSFPTTTAWRFVTVPTATNTRFPFVNTDALPLMRTFTNPVTDLDFYGFKKGDVDGSAER